MLNVEKIIRILGYTLYTILWSPVIILTIIVGPILVCVMAVRNGWVVKDIMRELYIKGLKNGIEHDMNFIKTGEW